MSFEFNTTQKLETFPSVCNCLKAWAEKVPSIECSWVIESKILHITVADSCHFAIHTIEEVRAHHLCQPYGPHSPIEYQLTLYGKDARGPYIQLQFFAKSYPDLIKCSPLQFSFSTFLEDAKDIRRK